MNITHTEFEDEQRRIKKLRKAGWTDDQPNGGIKSWRVGWRKPARNKK